jgi:WD40 repeat protein
MDDSHVDPQELAAPHEPWPPGVKAGRDAYVAARDLTVNYFTYRGTWTDGVAASPLVAESGGIDAPYRGLRPFGERDAALFFGREHAITDVLGMLSERLGGSGLLVVSGVSGAGKSSLLRAGVLPVLRQEGLSSAPSARSWPVLVLNPGSRPLDNLADGIAAVAHIAASRVRRELAADPSNFAALARQAALSGQREQYVDASRADGADRPRLMLIVDQCEQVFTQCGQAERHAFLTALYSASAGERDGGPSAMVMLVIRGDFEGTLAEYSPEDFPELGQAVQDRFFLRAMNEGELRMAITEPARRAHSEVADNLVQKLIADMRASAARGGQGDGRGGSGGTTAIGVGALPLLSHALDQAWRARSGPNLELADYLRIGGIEHALANTAQDVYRGLNTGQRQAARNVFIRLTATTSDGANTAIRVPVASLTAGLSPGPMADVHAVLAAFTSQRLLTMGSGTVEISHESLLTAWPLLSDTWLAETNADRMVRTGLHNTVTDWAPSRDPSYLYRGTLLRAAAETAKRADVDPVRYPPLTATEREFLQASSRAESRAARLRQAAIAGLAVLALVATTLAGTAVYSASNAHRQASNANRQHAIALSRQLAAQSLAQDQTDPQVAGQLATAAWTVSPTSQAKDAMLSVVAEQQEGALPGNGGVNGVAFSPGGKLLATAGEDGTARLWNTTTNLPVGKPIRVGTGTNGSVNGVAFSPNGKLLATADQDGTVQLWNPATGQPVGKPIRVGTGTNGGVNSVAFSPNGTLLATADADGTARLWNPATGRPVSAALHSSTNGGVNGVAFSPDGTLLATAGQDGTAHLWNTATGQPAGNPIPAGSGSIGLVEGVAFSPDGTLLATADFDGTTQLWDPATGEPVGNPITTSNHTNVTGVAFSPDGRLLAIAYADGATQLWNPAAGQPVGKPLTSGSNGAVIGVAFSPGGKLLATVDFDGTTQLWNPAASSGSTTSHPVNIDSGEAWGVAFSPDGKLLATTEGDGTTQLWNPATGQPVGKPITSGAALSVAFNPSGALLATGDQDGTARLWYVATGQPADQPITVSTSTKRNVIDMALSPNGELLATADDDGTARLWSVFTGQPVGQPITPAPRDGGRVWGVAFSPDGELLATADDDGTARLWNTATSQPVGKPISSNSITGAVISVAFSPDGKLLAAAYADGAAQVWNTATGQPVSAPLHSSTNLGVNAVAFSPDGKLLATAGDDGTLQLWDPATGQPIGPPITASTDAGSNSGVHDLAFSPDGKELATTDGDDTTRVWGVSLLKEPYQVLCNDFGPVAQGEWDQYAPSEPLPRVCS